MSFKIIADTFSVARDSDHFIQLKTLKNPNTEDQVWMAIEIIGDSKYARSVAQNIIDTMDDEFFSNTNVNAYERFEQTLKEINLIINNLNEKRKQSFGEINAIIAIFSGNNLYLTQSNNAEAYLIRGDKFSMISEGLKSKSDDLFVNIASGELRSDDKLIFSTARLLRLATHSQIVKVFNDGVAEAVEATRDLVMADEEFSIGVIAINTKIAHISAKKTNLISENRFLIQFKNITKKVFGAFTSKTDQRKSKISKKNILIIILVVIVVLMASIYFLMNSKRENEVRAEYRSKITEIHAQLQLANTKGYANDKETANNILSKVEKESRDILSANYFRAEVLTILDKVQDIRDNINNTKRLKNLKPYVDLAKKSTDVKTVGLVNLDGNFFAYGYNKIYKMILDQALDPKKIDDTEVVFAGTAMDDYDVLVFLTKAGRVIEYQDDQIRFASTADKVWKTGVDIASYGRYIYMLNAQDNQIYKYSRLRSSYSSVTKYNVDANLSDAISIAIDGNVYVLKKGGQIIKLYKGQKDSFQIKDLAISIADATQIFTSQKLKNIYLLDAKNRRVVVIEKDLKGVAYYKQQIVFDDLTDVKKIYVDDDERKLYLLTETAVYKEDM